MQYVVEIKERTTTNHLVNARQPPFLLITLMIDVTPMIDIISCGVLRW